MMAQSLPNASRPRDLAISFVDVWKRFSRAGGGTFDALRAISFDVPAGNVVAILGPSGSGKSTLLNIAAGLIRPDQGRVILNGQDLDANVDWHRIGYMFQDDRLLPWRTALDNVALALEAGSMPAKERRTRAQTGLALVGLSEFSVAYPHQLSGGMRSRVALARSMVSEPDILLMDEPFSRLDAQTRTVMHDELLRIHTMRSMSILFVTHDVEEAVILADRIVMFSPRPGEVRRQIDVTISKPRLGAHETAELVGELRALLSTMAETEELVV